MCSSRAQSTVSHSVVSAGFASQPMVSTTTKALAMASTRLHWRDRLTFRA
ncbi:MAG: hypothetical protein IJ083_01765 [Clostridia bacterium]|nr:hypothetical protein [Clostridia bacterium]